MHVPHFQERAWHLNVSVLLGSGNGTFQPAVSFAAGAFPQSVALGDVNRDGRPDLAVANSNSNDVSVLLNTGRTPPPAVTCNGRPATIARLGQGSAAAAWIGSDRPAPIHRRDLELQPDVVNMDPSLGLNLHKP